MNAPATATPATLSPKLLPQPNVHPQVKPSESKQEVIESILADAVVAPKQYLAESAAPDGE